MTIIDKQNTTGGQGSRPSQEHGAGVGIMAEQMMQEAAGKAIPAGYKQTEVGVIPEDWDVLPLNKIANFKNGVAHEDCVCESGKYVLVNSKFISSEGLSEKMSRDCRQPAVANDILMVMSDVPNGKAIAKCYLVNTSGRYTVNQRICILSSQLVNSKYLFYKLNRNPFYLSFDDGAKQTNLRRQDVLDCLLAIPAEVEQIAIANVLSDSDALIDALEQLIAKKQAIKSATMQQLLTGRTRLPAFALRPDGTPKGYKPSELGDIPEDWEILSLAHVTNCLDNLRVPLNESQRLKMRGEIPYCGANGIVGWVNDFLIDDDVILMAEDGGYFDEYVTRPIAYRIVGKCWVNNHAHILKAQDGYEQGYIFYSLVHKDIQRYLASGTRAKLNKAEMEKIEILIPIENQEQTAIANILSDMDNELQALTQKLEKARALKQGMMQQLLTGKIRLPLAVGA
ncbi:restriction endonuclease subunit S [Aeromonas caviae]|uniref:Restriction endonuclease subunit S n=1 Tax=Aeromonas caviae TaxID=648 RepID=A0AAE9PKG3_AERCA|nr:restriction endonuclease subunit S [Aeromonas caviae]UZC86075.2 restriction endonuclease subunit S [Aeromonas caviae]BBG89707.1 type I restriction modification system subunit S [Aeromonas caviae]BBT53367.1 type I restriction modification system subunit S [Aeromonas caviae]